MWGPRRAGCSLRRQRRDGLPAPASWVHRTRLQRVVLVVSNDSGRQRVVRQQVGDALALALHHIAVHHALLWCVGGGQGTRLMQGGSETHMAVGRGGARRVPRAACTSTRLRQQPVRHLCLVHLGRHRKPLRVRAEQARHLGKPGGQARARARGPCQQPRKATRWAGAPALARALGRTQAHLGHVCCHHGANAWRLWLLWKPVQLERASHCHAWREAAEAWGQSHEGKYARGGGSSARSDARRAGHRAALRTTHQC